MVDLAVAWSLLNEGQLLGSRKALPLATGVVRGRARMFDAGGGPGRSAVGQIRRSRLERLVVPRSGRLRRARFWAPAISARRAISATCARLT